jgi:hypothetical protein
MHRRADSYMRKLEKIQETHTYKSRGHAITSKKQSDHELYLWDTPERKIWVAQALEASYVEAFDALGVAIQDYYIRSGSNVTYRHYKHCLSYWSRWIKSSSSLR